MTDTARNRIDDLAAFAAANGWTYQAAAEPPALSGTCGSTPRPERAGPYRRRRLEVGRSLAGRGSESVRQSGIVTIRTSVSINVPVKSINLGYLAIGCPGNCRTSCSTREQQRHRVFASAPTSAESAAVPEATSTRTSTCSRRRATSATRCTSSRPTSWLWLLIDETGDLDVEARRHADRLSPGGFDLLQTPRWGTLAPHPATVGAKAWTQTDGYSDDRAVPGSRIRGSRRPAPEAEPAAVGVDRDRDRWGRRSRDRGRAVSGVRAVPSA